MLSLVLAAAVASAVPDAVVSAVPDALEAEYAGAKGVAMFRAPNGKIGFGATVDEWGVPRIDRVIVPATYDWATDFANGSAIVRRGDRYGLIDTQGREIAPLSFDYIATCERGYAITYQGGLAGLWNCDKRIEQFTPRYAAVQTPSRAGTLGVVDGTNRWGVVRMDGTVVVPLTNVLLNHLESGLTTTFNAGVWKTLGPDGSVFQENGTDVQATGHGAYTFKDPTTHRWGMMDGARQVLAAPQYDTIKCEGVFCVAFQGERQFALDAATGRSIVPGGAPYILHGGPVLIVGDDPDQGPFYYVDRTGKRLFNRTFEVAWPFSPQGVAVVKSGGKLGVIDSAGAVVLPFVHDSGPDAAIEVRGEHIFAARNGLWGVTDLKGRTILPFEFWEPVSGRNLNPFKATPQSRSPYVVRRLRDDWAAFTHDFQTILAPGAYEYISPTPDYRWINRSYVVEIRKGGLSGAYDLTHRRELVSPRWRKAYVSGDAIINLTGDVASEGYAFDVGPAKPASGLEFETFYAPTSNWVVTRHAGNDTFHGLADARGAALTKVEYPGKPGNPGVVGLYHPPLVALRTRDKLGLVDGAARAVTPMQYDRMYREIDYPLPGGYDTTVVPERGQLVLLDPAGRPLVRSSDFGSPSALELRQILVGPAPAYVATFARSNGTGKHERLLLGGRLYEAAGGSIGPNDIRAEFNEGLMAVRVGGRFGYIDVMGVMVIPPQFDQAGRFINGLAVVKTGASTSQIDRTGRKRGIATIHVATAARSVQVD